MLDLGHGGGGRRLVWLTTGSRRRWPDLDGDEECKDERAQWQYLHTRGEPHPLLSPISFSLCVSHSPYLSIHAFEILISAADSCQA